MHDKKVPLVENFKVDKELNSEILWSMKFGWKN
jgi:hypothetical protein